MTTETIVETPAEIVAKPGQFKKSNIRKIPVADLLLNPANPREELDVPSMMDDIIQIGRVTEPLHVQEETMYVMRGNRRLSAVRRLLENPALPANIKANIEKLDCFIYKGLSTREFTEIVYDHGQTKPLSRVETVKSVWGLQKQMYGEVEIATILYHVLATYTRSGAKAHTAAGLQGEERVKFLKSWLHGTLSQFIMVVFTLGDAVQRQLVLQDTAADRKLTDAEAKEKTWNVTRDRIKVLANCKKADEEAGGWNRTTGGKTFNEKIKEFIGKDSGEITPDKPRRYTQAEIKAVADACHSTTMKMAYLHCAGELQEGQKGSIDQIDVEAARLERLRKAILETVDRVDLGSTFGGTEVQGLLNQMLTGTEVTYREYVSRFLGPVVVNEEKELNTAIKDMTSKS